MPPWLKWMGAFVAGLALGLAVAWLIRPVETTLPPHAPTTEAAPIAAEPVPVAEPQPPESHAPRQPTEPEPPASFNADSEPGTGTITGVVNWSDGAPCAGLPLVFERTEVGRPWAQDIARASPDERRAFLERIIRWGDAYTLETPTGDDGRFEVSGLHEESYRVTSGDRLRPLSRPWVTCKAGAELSLTVRRVVMVEFEFELEGGARPGDVKLQVKSQSDGMRFLQPWVPGRAYPVDPGACSVTATGGPHHLWKAQVDFEALPQGFDGPVRVVLQPGNALIIHRDQPVPYYWVVTQVMPTRQPGVPFTPHDVRAGLSEWVLSVPNPSIHPNLTPGRYTVLCMLGMAAILHQQEVVLEGGVQEVHLTMPPVRREDHMLVRVTGPDGKPLSNAHIEIEGPGFFSTAAAFVREPGLYWLRCIEPSREGEYRVTVRTSLSKRIERVPTDFRGELSVQFGDRARLLLHADNIPADSTGLVLGVVTRGDDRRNAFDVLPGQRTVPGLIATREFTLASGPATVVLGCFVPGGFGVHVVYTREITLSPGNNEERVDLSQFTNLRVGVPEGTGALFVRGASRAESRDAVDGVVVFPWLQSGTWWLEGALGTMRVPVPAGGIIEFKPLPYNALWFEALDTAGVLAAAGVQAGDMIRQVNGVDLSGARAEVFGAIARAAEAGTLNLSVERAGRWQSVAVTAEDWKSLSGHRLVARRVGD